MAPGINGQITHLRARQRGAALLVILTLIVLAASYALLKRVNASKPDIVRAAGDAKVLGQAKAALVGYALRSGVRPGELPCPDILPAGGDGRADACTGAIGRLPWFDLGLPDLRDSGGERLWYALASEFDGSTPINSDTDASLSLDAGNRIVAVIIAPGPALDNQNRAPLAQGNPVNYLEDDNNNNDTQYVSRSAADFNDQVIVITREELLTRVEQRVAAEIGNVLNAYYNSNGFFFPNPAPWGSTDCDTGISQGLLPLNINAGCGTQPDWGGAATLPAWFAANDWNRVIWYAVAPACGPSTPGCAGGGFITVQNLPAPNDNKRAILVSPGPVPTGGQTRPAAALTDLLDDSQNNDGIDLVFAHLPIDAGNNDRILVVAP